MFRSLFIRQAVLALSLHGGPVSEAGLAAAPQLREAQYR